jgi:hypothetical protein
MISIIIGHSAAKRLFIWVEPTVLLLYIAYVQRIKIRCYKIGQGYASFLLPFLARKMP